MRYHLTLVRMAIIIKHTNAGEGIIKHTNAGEGVEKKEPSYAAGRNANWRSHYGKPYGASLRKEKKKTKNEVAI